MMMQKKIHRGVSSCCSVRTDGYGEVKSRFSLLLWHLKRTSLAFCKRPLSVNTLLLFTDNCAANENTGDVFPPVTYSHTSPVLRAVEISIHTDKVILCLSGNVETTCASTTSLSNPLYGCNMKFLCKAACFVLRAMLLVPFHFTRPVHTKVLSFSVS